MATSNRAQSVRSDFQEKLDEATGDKAAQLRAKGDLITSFAYTWTAPAKELVCRDFSTDEAVVFLLKEGQRPVDAARDCYRAAKKLERSRASLQKLLERAEDRCVALEEADTSLESLNQFRSYDDILALRELSGELEAFERTTVVGWSLDVEGEAVGSQHSDSKSSPATGRKSSRKESQGKQSGGKKPSKVRSKDGGSVKGETGSATTTSSAKRNMQGLLVLAVSAGQQPEDLCTLIVGRTAQQNDRVSFRVARESDLWFHVQGWPGSHCLLRLEANQDATQGQLQLAADVAAHFSKARGEASVPVTCCSPKQLKRASGAGPGSVKLDLQSGAKGSSKLSKTIIGRPDAGKLLVDRVTSPTF